MSTGDAIFETDGPLAILTFNRPRVRNAMTSHMYQALADACDEVDRAPDIHVLVLRGAGGKAFVAGTDINQFRGFTSAGDGLRYEEQLERALDRLERVAKPTIAQVQGVAAGGGCAIAVTCDLRIATPESTFGIPIARTLGNCLAAATLSRLVDVLGPAVVKEMLFTGRLFSATESQALGLVNRVVQAEVLGATVREMALQIAANAPLTVRASKELVRRVLAKRRLCDHEDRDQIALCYGSDDFREGIAAFLEKRPPRWVGR